jgi:hypothetical protein
MKTEEDSSSGGSDSAPSEDNLKASDLIKNLPSADKTLKRAIRKEKEAKMQPRSFLKKKLSDMSVLKVEKKEVAKVVKKEPQPAAQPQKPQKPKPEMKDAVTQTDRSDY